MKIQIYCICLCISLCLIQCNRGEQTTESGKSRIAFVMKTMNNPFFIRMQEGAEEAARQHEVDVIVQAPDRELDVERQMQIIENLIQTQVDVLCITPSGSREIIPAIARANQANIPVIIVDTRVDEDAAQAAGISTAAFIGSDNYQGGVLAGQHVVNHFHADTEIAILEGVPGHETADSRLQGFRDGIKDAPHIRIVSSQPANAERDLGFNVTQNMLQTNPGIKAIFAINDMMALGAVEAIAAAGKTGDIMVIGFDAVDEAKQAIRNGSMTGSIAQFPYDMGKIAIETSVKILQGESVPQSIPVKIELITRENLEES
ncbi:MAG: sugar ABC transporter substrate-binding protein [bacterium]|jgi:ribose transport system substrate-binding protein